MTADYTSRELTGRSNIEQELARVAHSHPGLRYIITNVDTNQHSESVDDFFVGTEGRLRMGTFNRL